MALSKEIISKVKNLREHGYSIPEISRACELSKSTVLRHIKNVAIQAQYHERWLQRRNASKIIAQRHWEQASKKAEESLSALTKRELIILAAALYWAEGSKRDFCFSNSDPNMIRVFVHILRTCFGVKAESLVISLRIYDDLNRSECIQFWSNITGIKLGESTSIEVLHGKKNGRLKYGMCRLRVRKGGLLLKEFFSLVKRICFLLDENLPL